MAVQLNATDKIPVTLEAGQWNQVLLILAEGPFRVVAPLIEEIRSQCMTQERGAEIDAGAGAAAE
jgi:hypothetical protein